MMTLIYDCPCGNEDFVNHGTSHKDGKDPDVYRIVCTSCGETHDVGFEEMFLKEKSQAEIDAHMPVTTFDWT